jgi:phage-related protein
MPTFTPPINPSYDSSSKEVRFRIKASEFGDGYRQRSGDGLNARGENVTLAWDHIDTTDADAITAFLDARGGWEAFDYTLPDEVTARKWTCESYSKSWEAKDLWRLTATLKEEFDL